MMSVNIKLREQEATCSEVLRPLGDISKLNLVLYASCGDIKGEGG